MARKQKKLSKRESVPAPKIPDVVAEPKALSPKLQKTRNVNLLRAAEKKQWGRMKSLLEAGAKPNELTGVGFSALTFAAAEGQDKLVQMMVDAGVEVSIDNFASRVAFTRAISGGHTKTSDILLNAGKLGDGESIVPPPQHNMGVEYVFLDPEGQVGDDEDW